MRAKLAKIIDFAVVNDPIAAGGIRHGLLPVPKINDAEPDGCQRRVIVDEIPRFIGTTMGDKTDHSREFGNAF